MTASFEDRGLVAVDGSDGTGRDSAADVVAAAAPSSPAGTRPGSMKWTRRGEDL